jgi:hypothetical protein
MRDWLTQLWRLAGPESVGETTSLETQESQASGLFQRWYAVDRGGTLVLQVRSKCCLVENSTCLPQGKPVFCSVQDFNWDEAHSQNREQFALLSLLI